MTHKLKPPKRFRQVIPRCCFTCLYKRYDDGTTFCSRDPDNYGWDTGEMDEVTCVCDRWQKDRER